MADRITRCKTCEKEGTKSILYVSPGGDEKGPAQLFYDEDGKKHVHDPTVYYTVYHCSKGHQFTTKSVGKCPSCEWVGGKE